MTAKKKIWVVLGILFGAIIILSIINSFVPTETEKRFQANLEAEEVKIAEQKKEKQKIFDYNLEHKEEHYQKGLEFLKEKNYQEALEMFDKIILVDKSYKDIQEKARITYITLAEIEEKRIRIRKKRNLAEANQRIIDARKLSIDTQEYDQFTLPQIQLILNQAMKESGFGDYIQITVTMRNDIVDFDCELGQLFSRANVSDKEFAEVIAACGGGIGDMTANYTPLFITITSWKSGKMWILSQGERTGWISTADCRKAVTLGPLAGSLHLLNVIKSVKK